MATFPRANISLSNATFSYWTVLVSGPGRYYYRHLSYLEYSAGLVVEEVVLYRLSFRLRSPYLPL